VIIQEIQAWGEKWKGTRGKIKVGEFGDWFRLKYQRLLIREGHPSLTNKIIARYLKEAGLYRGEKRG